MHKTDFRGSERSHEALTMEPRNSLLEIFKKLKFPKNLMTWIHWWKESQNGQTYSFPTQRIWHFEKSFQNHSDKNYF